MTRDRYAGCLLGLALGDALGASHEGGPVERALWFLIGRTRSGKRRWTDDTQMSLDLAQSLLARGELDLDHLAQTFAHSYRWSRGYGPGAAKLLKRIARGMPWHEANHSVFGDGSYGNGGAMRAPVIGLYFADQPEGLVTAARASASVTHAHPLGMEGAALIASATREALFTQDPHLILTAATHASALEPYLSRLKIARTWLESAQEPEAEQVRLELGNRILASQSSVTAVYLAARFLASPFDELMDFVVKVGGDVDTISAMAGAVWGASNGAKHLPAEKLSRLEQKDRVESIASALWDAIHARE